MTRTKFLWALKFTAQKIMLKNWKKIRDYMHHFCPYSCPVIQCVTKAYLEYSIAPSPNIS